MKTKLATFGAGCFWSVQVAFDDTPGVVRTTVGYTGGHTANPTYEDVCSDETGHAEVVQVAYDPSRTSYEELLRVFFTTHDPTQKNRQGPDVGTQYRSAIFTHDAEQERLARAAIANEETRRSKKLATTIEPAKQFYPAESYHQKYLEKRGAKTCHI